MSQISNLRSSRPLPNSDERKPFSVITFVRKPESPATPSITKIRETLEYWDQTVNGHHKRYEKVLVPDHENLYRELISYIDQGGSQLTLKAYRYNGFGFDHVTVVEYFDEKGKQLGWDRLPLADTTAETYNLKSADNKATRGYEKMSFWDYVQLPLDWSVATVIGAKEISGELIKAPLTALEASTLEPLTQKGNPLSPFHLRRTLGAVESDVEEGFKGATWRFRVRTRHQPLQTLGDLLRQVPLAGFAIDAVNPQRSTKRNANASRELLAVSPGIQHGGEREQFTQAWEGILREHYPDATVLTTPYSYGSATDTLWSLLNISHGHGLEEARHLVFDCGLKPEDQLSLYAFSGGIESSIDAAYALDLAGIPTANIVGTKGPAVGISRADHTIVHLAPAFTDIPGSATAKLARSLYFYLPSNITYENHANGGGHYLPYFPNGSTREPYLNTDPFTVEKPLTRANRNE